MGRKKLEAAGPPGSAARLRVELTGADWIISVITWGSAAGVIVWSMLNATPYVRAHVTPGWEDTAFVLPVVVDLAFVGSLRADEIASRYGASGGVWAGLLRLFTGAASLFLNVGHSAENGDWTGVFQHLIAPGILVLVAEAGPAYRRRLSNRLTEVELEEAAKAEAARKEQDQEDERLRLLAQEEADRQADRDRQEAQRLRLEKWEDEEKKLDLEERREAARASRTLDSRRLDLEEKRLTPAAEQPVSLLAGMSASQRASEPPRTAVAVPAVNGTYTRPPAAPVRVPVAPVASAPHPGVPAPQARTEAANGHPVAPQADPRTTAADRPASASVPSSATRTMDSAAFARPAEPAAAAPRQDATASVSAAQATPARVVTARVDEQHQEQPEQTAGPVKDWDLPGLPADCAPGRVPELLTDNQAHARIRYGHANGWAQRRVATFAGRSPSTVHKHMKALDPE